VRDEKTFAQEGWHYELEKPEVRMCPATVLFGPMANLCHICHAFCGALLTLLDVQDELSFKGVVFNEMKGVYSSPDSMNSRATQHALFPNNTYAHDSGGDPAAIPDLTFEECVPTTWPDFEIIVVFVHSDLLRMQSKLLKGHRLSRFKGFHEKYYHPSNARFWFYGDDPAEERLRILSSYLDEFDERQIDSTVRPQPLNQVRPEQGRAARCSGQPARA
jgi:Zn-dependent M16 (insulinase) family peptidase